MAIKVGRIPDLSCEAFYFDMERRGIELHHMASVALAAAAGKGEIDAGPVPLLDCFGLEEHFRPLSGFCIAAINQAGTSILHSKQPIQSLAGARIGVTENDATSSRLLQVLLAFKHQVIPEAYVGMEDSYDAFLLTGNQALRRRRGVRDYPHKYDLGEEWHQWTGLPFVFARWMVRNDMDAKDVAWLEECPLRRAGRVVKQPVPHVRTPGRSSYATQGCPGAPSKPSPLLGLAGREGHGPIR